MPYQNYEHWKTTPISDNPHLSIVIPAYNEEERIVPTVGAIAAYVSTLGFEWELIVADDGSTDDTVKLLQELELVNLRVLIAAKNGGKGSAVRRGMLAARGDYVLFTDADNSTPIENVTPVLKKLTDEGYDVAVGSRAADGASESNKSFFRHLMSGGLRLLVRYVLNIRVKDTQCGFKMYSKEAAQKLHRQQTIDGFSFDLESLYLASKYGYKAVEVPVEWMDAPGSKVDAKKEAIRFLQDMTRIRINDIKGVYNKPPTNLPIIDASDMAQVTSARKKLINIAVVSPYPPSKSSLNEYGYHFITALRKKPEVGQIYILSDELPDGEYYQPITEEGAPTSIISCWKFGAVNNPTRIQSAVKTLKPDLVLFNIQFASFASSRV
ncbi:MAG: glycosyltransferase, partial [Phototrophicaceae bacterium]